MTASLNKVAIFGAGSMGAGIAAQFANAGIPVVLLDRPGAGSQDGAAVARAGIERQLKIGGFMHPDAARLVTPARAEEDIALVSDADWIIEAIVEDRAAKQALYRRLQPLRRAGAIVSSNTSTLAREALADGLDPDFRRHFLITHFFNPPRHMPLMELVSAAEVSPTAVDLAVRGGETALGKTVIRAKDTPGFIANRLGCYWIGAAVLEAMRCGLDVDVADATIARAFGAPRTGVFGLLDLIGLDLVPLVWGSLAQALPADDGCHRYDISRNSLFTRMIEAGRLGRKTRAGFYQQASSGGLLAMDLESLDYRPVQFGELPAPDLTGAVDSTLDRYVWTVFKHFIRYACDVAAEIADDVAAIDAGMALGYSWKQGPFALADQIGVAAIVARFERDGDPVPALLRHALAHGGFYSNDGMSQMHVAGTMTPIQASSGQLSLRQARGRGPAVLRNGSAALWDLGGGIAGLELTTKMNVLDEPAFDLIREAIARVPEGFAGLVVGNDHPRAFSAGADLRFILQCMDRNDEAALRRFVAAGQDALRALRFAPFPVVAALHGLALGGGCELALHCDAIVAAAETTAGLPESKVGLIPAWGGCAQLLIRALQTSGVPKGPVAIARQAYAVIAGGQTSGSAALARDMGILRADDRIVMNRGQVLAQAHARCLELAAGYRAPEPVLLPLAGPSGSLALRDHIDGEVAAGRKSAASASVEHVLADVLTGGPDADAVPGLEESAVYALERDAMLALTRSPVARARIEHMLRTGKPLNS